MKNKFYITTPIYYVTAKPHLGSLYATLLADVLARWQKLQAKKVTFVTGTDEHGQKVAQAAQAAGKDPQAFVDSFIPAYKETWQVYDIGYDTFIRTTDKYHVLGAQGLAWSRRSRSNDERRRLLGYFQNVVTQGLKKHPFGTAGRKS